MNPIRSLIVCRCKIYRRIDDEALDRLISAARTAGIDLRVMDDLCYEAARRPEKLRDAEAIAGCHFRTLAALCTYAGIDPMPQLFDLSRNLDEIIQNLDRTTGKPGARESEERVPTDWVAWYPAIDPNRCVHCKKCAEFCLFGVYAVENQHVRVVQPASCKTDCPACARMCPAKAIIFPKSTEPAINGSPAPAVKPETEQSSSLRDRLKARKPVRLFREDQE